MKIQIIKCLKDNYSYLIIDETNNNACVVDPSEAKPIINFVENKNLKLKFMSIMKLKLTNQIHQDNLSSIILQTHQLS